VARESSLDKKNFLCDEKLSKNFKNILNFHEKDRFCTRKFIALKLESFPFEHKLGNF
jgi:hypothetical protein